MSRILLVSILIFVAFLEHSAFALDCESSGVVPYFGNGMFNSAGDAEKSRRALEIFMHDNRLISENARVELAYNFSENVAEQLLQVATQKDEETGRSFFRWISNLSSAPAFFRKMAQVAVASYDIKAYSEDGDLRDQIKNYEANMTSGKFVVVVGHSQGNFYSNMAWENLKRSKKYDGKFALVGVAVPASYIGGGGPYSTLTQDEIMNSVRVLKGALPANITNAASSVSGHEFVTQYLEGNLSGPKIANDLKDIISKMANGVSTPSTESLEYLDEGLSPFLHYACQLQASKAKLTDSECIALAALDKTYSWFGVSRKERSLEVLDDWISQCDTDEYWRSSTRFDYLSCSMFPAQPSFDPRGDTNAELAFVPAEHPECVWTNRELSQRANAHTVAAARNLLRSPPKVFRASSQ